MVKRSFKRKALKAICLFLVVNLVADCLSPTVAWALTSGPVQPEYSSFEPVATTNMVNEFTGAFTYNLPVLNVPGPNGSSYPMSLSYHSGVSPEEESSWVGLGWTLNPGAINRGKQGMPDDFNGSTIKHYNKSPDNLTIVATPSISAELYSVDANGDKKPGSSQSIGLSFSYRYNNYRGFGSQLGLHFSVFSGLASLNFSVSGEEAHSFNGSINPAALLTRLSKKARKDQNTMKKLLKSDHEWSDAECASFEKAKQNTKDRFKPSRIAKAFSKSVSNASSYGLSTLGDDKRVSTVSSYSGTSHNISFNLGLDPSPLHIGIELGIAGTFTRQLNAELVTVTNANGFLYSGSNDYSVEKEDVFNKRDNYLPIPHQAPDMFMVTGEGLVGSFKLNRPSISRFEPTSVSSLTTIFNVAYEATAGLNMEPFGFNAGIGLHTLSINGRDNNFNHTNPTPDPFFRFTNDAGGKVMFSNNTATQNDQAVAPVIGSLDNTFVDPTGLGDILSQPGASSYIGYATVGDRLPNLPSNNSRFRSRTYDPATTAHIDHSNNLVGDIKGMIAEIYTVNESGSTFVYGLPVFNANEKSISYSMNSNNGSTSYDGTKAWTGNAESAKIKVGEEYTSAYPNTHLLTLITSPDYIDRNLDGPSQDDFGGWTSFKYRNGYNIPNYQNKGNNADWFKWRLPYTGFSYNKGELSDSRDDMGSMQSGRKEVYYMTSIETKTHIAYFITNKTVASTDQYGITLKSGSGIERTDGCSAMDDNDADDDIGIVAGAVKKVERLERIELYSKTDPSKPISTVFFDYFKDTDAEVLLKNVPNSIYGSTGARGGKLTLKKVWFEHDGVVSSKIAPYEFKYEYKDLNASSISSAIKSEYPLVTSFADELSVLANKSKQNPNYDQAVADGWSSNFYQGKNRYRDMRPWLYQGEIKSTDVGYEVFDPAAWQLKQIKLPTGGEILVQYEQHEYMYVQDQRALAMVNLMSGTYDGDKFYLNMKDIGMDFSTATTLEKDSYKKTIQDYLAKEKLFFKFLYRLLDNAAPSIQDCASDYVEGYVYAEANYDGGGFYVQLGKPPTNGQKRYYKPFEVCKSFVTRTKAGAGINSGCNDPESVIQGSPLAAVKAVGQRIITDLNLFSASSNCKNISLSNSYLRVPTYKAKRGGGIRVKRILMYDKGIETGSEVLYGTEYFYQNVDGTSSGVATNEPSNMRDESALVRSINKRRDPTNIERVIAGVERENYEGPFGEALLPSPSVGYSRVVTQNIHTGKTGTGFKVSEFLTVKDFPFKDNISQMEQLKPFPINIPAILVNVIVDQKAAAQTYCFISNNMHGQQKRIAIFGGKYNPGQAESSYVMSFEEINEYYKPGEKVKVLHANGVVDDDYVGREETVTLESKVVEDRLMDLSVQIDIDMGIFGIYIVPQISACPYFRYELRSNTTTVVNKTVSYIAIPKRTTTTQDGIVHVSENKIFDEATGSPVVTTTYDGYAGLKDLAKEAIPGGPEIIHDGTYTNYTIPAHLVFGNMGQKIKNQRLVITTSGNLSAGGVLTISDVSKFVKGDLLRVTGTSGDGLYYVKAIGVGQLTLQKVSISSAFSGSISKVEILNSGYTNQLGNVATKIATYGVSTLPTNINLRKFIPSNVLSVSADVYSDDWGNSLLEGDPDYNLNANDFESARSGKWRLASSYAYKTKVKDAENTVYNSAGVFEAAYEGFDYDNISNLSYKWIKTNNINIYSPNGTALEEQNAIGVKSTSDFGYNENVPVLIAQNAAYSSVKFKSFEDQVSIGSVVIDNTTAHTGKKSVRYDANTTNDILTSIKLDVTSKQKGVQIKFWAKSTAEVINDINSNLRLDFKYSSGVLQPVITKIAQVGEWTLYEALVKDVKNIGDTDFTLTPVYSGTTPLWMDDLRLQPYDAQMNCYVYDAKTLRLIASFDDQHFGLLYQYNGEGKLIRKLVETERGQKTVSETQYNVPKVTY